MDSPSPSKTFIETFPTTLFARMKDGIFFFEIPSGVTGANDLPFEISPVGLELMNDVPDLVPGRRM